MSTDLVTWKNLGLCLIPDQGDGYDNKGVYSGSAMPIDDKIYLYYTGNHRDEDWTRHAYTCLARLSKDGWVEKQASKLSLTTKALHTTRILRWVS